MHHQDTNNNEVIFCIEIKGEDKPKSIEFGQSEFLKNLHKISIFENISTRDEIIDLNTQSSFVDIPQKFYFSYEKKSTEKNVSFASISHKNEDVEPSMMIVLMITA